MSFRRGISIKSHTYNNINEIINKIDLDIKNNYYEELPYLMDDLMDDTLRMENINFEISERDLSIIFSKLDTLYASAKEINDFDTQIIIYGNLLRIYEDNLILYYRP